MDTENRHQLKTFPIYNVYYKLPNGKWHKCCDVTEWGKSYLTKTLEGLGREIRFRPLHLNLFFKSVSDRCGESTE